MKVSFYPMLIIIVTFFLYILLKFLYWNGKSLFELKEYNELNKCLDVKYKLKYVKRFSIGKLNMVCGLKGGIYMEYFAQPSKNYRVSKKNAS